MLSDTARNIYSPNGRVVGRNVGGGCLCKINRTAGGCALWAIVGLRPDINLRTNADDTFNNREMSLGVSLLAPYCCIAAHDLLYVTI